MLSLSKIIHTCVYKFKKTVIDVYIQEWRTNINNSHVLILYNSSKEHYRLEPYLGNIV